MLKEYTIIPLKLTYHDWRVTMKSSKRIEAIASQLIANGRELVGSGAVITTVGNQLLEQGETLLAQTTKITDEKTKN